MTYYIVTFIVLLIVTHYLLTQTHKDTFIPALTIIADEKPESVDIWQDANMSTTTIKPLSSIPHVTVSVQSPSASASNNILRVQPACNIDKSNTNFRLLAATGDDVLLYFIKPIELPVKDITEDGVTIGYSTDKEKQLIEAIFKSYEDLTKVPKYTLKQLQLPTTIDKNTFLINKIDCLTLFNTQEYIQEKQQYSIALKFTVPDYGELISVHKLAITLPLAKVRIMDFSMLYPQLRGKSTEIKTIIAFELLIGGDVSLEDKKANVEAQLKAIVTSLNQPASFNHYARFLKPYKVASEHAGHHDNFVSKRDSMQVLEQFQPQYAGEPFPVSENISGFYDSEAQTLTVYNTTAITEIPLRVGVRFNMSNQDRTEQNGIYMAVTITNKYTILQKMQPTTEPTTPNSNRFQPGYLCYDHPEIQSKGQCESDFDQFGKPKTRWQKTYWDKPCENNSDCPFYQANKNYPNYRGGCIDGRCEMPIGIEAVSYRLYDKESSPYCHGCKDGTNPTCCEEQKDKKQYPNLKSPQYAFELDSFEWN